jgi:hypothetical protein
VLSGASTAALQATLRLPAEQLVRSLAGRRKERQLAMEEYSCGWRPGARPASDLRCAGASGHPWFVVRQTSRVGVMRSD